MIKDIVFVSDFFVDEILGGAEKYNDSLIQDLRKDRDVFTLKTTQLTKEIINNNNNKIFIIANFFLLNEEIKFYLKHFDYIILEHDHKYISNNNPSVFVNFLAPESKIINREFYQHSLAVVCQSKIHSEILQKNLFIKNIINMKGSLWSPGDIDILKNNMNKEKKIKFAILKTANKNKGMSAAIDFCKKNNRSFTFLESKPYCEFIEELSNVENLVFFPQWLESYNRLSIEAKILGCKIITNTLVGASSEDYFKLKNEKMLNKVEENNVLILRRWREIIDQSVYNFVNYLKDFKITIFCPIYNADKHINGFLEDMVSQTFFDKCELIIIDANSPGNEKEVIDNYSKQFDNILYKKLDYRASVMETENMAIKLSTADFIAQCCVDDRHSPKYLEIMSKHLLLSEDIDLVYSDCLQTKFPNETFESNNSRGILYEHSKNTFSKENMIKCLPGPTPMWRRKVHSKIGFFREHMKYAGDWEFFLRMVKTGSKFKKIDEPLGLYYYNAEGLSTSLKYQKERNQEEADVFFEYKNIFGEKNYNKYYKYFNQFRRNNDK